MANEVILIVDDDVLDGKTLGTVLEEKGFSTIIVTSGSEAVNLKSPSVPEIALIDLKLDDMSGLDVIRQLKQTYQHLEFIVITAFASSESVIEAMNLGSFGYLEKPYNTNQLLQMIHKALEKQKGEIALIESEDKYRLLVENAPVGILSIDCNGVISQFNQKSLELFDFALDKNIRKINLFSYFPFYQAGIAGDLQQCINQGRAATYEYRYVTQTGMKKTLRCNLAPRRNTDNRITGVLGIFEDVSNLKQMESHLKKVIKIESIGMLAGGIAHDFNNILSAIIGFSELALDSAVNDKQEQNLQEVLKASKRAKNLVKQILTVSRQEETEKQPLNIRMIAKDVISFLRASLPTTIEMKHTVPKEEIQIFGNLTQIHQVLLNLCINASQAMETTGGVLKMTITKLSLDHQTIGNTIHSVSGEYVKISVTDTGVGIAPSALQKIFEPYYTTKRKGEGTGLGLAVVDSIVKAHEGLIDVSSTVGQGTLFEVYLPVIKATKGKQKGEAPVKQKGKGSILLVDDEKSIVKLYTQIFESLGYSVEGMTSSQAALKKFKARPDFYDIMITDMTMPQMTGDILSKEVLTIRPQFPIILCTGYSKRMNLEKAHKLGIRRFVEKPVDGATLASIVHEILNKP